MLHVCIHVCVCACVRVGVQAWASGEVRVQAWRGGAGDGLEAGSTPIARELDASQHGQQEMRQGYTLRHMT